MKVQVERDDNDALEFIQRVNAKLAELQLREQSEFLIVGRTRNPFGPLGVGESLNVLGPISMIRTPLRAARLGEAGQELGARWRARVAWERHYRWQGSSYDKISNLTDIEIAPDASRIGPIATIVWFSSRSAMLTAGDLMAHRIFGEMKEHCEFVRLVQRADWQPSHPYRIDDTNWFAVPLDADFSVGQYGADSWRY